MAYNPETSLKHHKSSYRPEELLQFERPDCYIESDDSYLDEGLIPVLTANKGFILGYTDNCEGIYDKGPCIIFDDFTLDSKLVKKPFKVRSSAIKILTAQPSVDLDFAYELLQFQRFPSLGHARHYISVVQPHQVTVPSFAEQACIGKLFKMANRHIEEAIRKAQLLQQLKAAYLQQMFV